MDPEMTQVTDSGGKDSKTGLYSTDSRRWERRKCVKRDRQHKKHKE